MSRLVAEEVNDLAGKILLNLEVTKPRIALNWSLQMVSAKKYLKETVNNYPILLCYIKS